MGTGSPGKGAEDVVNCLNHHKCWFSERNKATTWYTIVTYLHRPNLRLPLPTSSLHTDPHVYTPTSALVVPLSCLA
jgi:hypothetical protein